MNYPFLIISAVKIGLVLAVLLTSLAYIVYVERKVAGHIQARVGPNRTGPFGLLQPLADLLKFIFKEDTAPERVEGFIYYLAPFLAVFFALLPIAVIPFGPPVQILGYETWLQITDLNIGLLFVFGMGSMAVYGVALAGWSSGSKYSLLGGLRSSAQMVSYELGLGFGVVGVLLMANTLSLRQIVEHQSGYWFGVIPQWHVFPQFVGFLVFMVAAFAETNRLPFDLPEAEGELVGGFHTEYSSLKFAMFFTAEYAHMVTGSCVATVLFFGGWLRPLPWDFMRFVPVVVLLAAGALIIRTALRSIRPLDRQITPILGAVVMLVGLAFLHPGISRIAEPIFWFASKVAFFVFFFIWVRWSFPRFRYDQLMNLGWKWLLPVAAANVMITGLIIALRG